MKVSDFRSDTVTRPTEAMRKAMAAAEVGDDVYREDPTIRSLEEMAADAVGQESALFVPTGSMGNQIAVHLHCRPGDEVLMEAWGHTMQYELGAMAALSGAMPHPLQGDRGVLEANRVTEALRPEIYYLSRQSLLILENTHNMAGGTVWPLPVFRETVEAAREAGMRVHLDGARLFNAAIAADQPPSTWASLCDSVMFCLSKGLGAPVGSMLCGKAPFIEEARRTRKMLGGGMRQVGVLGAAGIVALKEGPGHLAEDHRRADELRKGLASLEGLSCRGETNIVLVELGAQGPDAPTFVAGLKERGVLAGAVTSHRVRLVTHRDVGDTDVSRALDAARDILG